MPQEGNPGKYRMKISRLTIDKLGIQLYDKVWAVMAELIANSYDADATKVVITLPFNEWLAAKSGGETVDLGREITIEDDGQGMTASEVNEFYLRVGINRRARGETSPKGRKVMGRKGIGKLAPFGICREIEVITAGGEPDSEGTYEVSHLVLQYDGILTDEETDYEPVVGELDGTRKEATGTKIILRDFDRRKVPSAEDLHRRLAARFGLRQTDWRVEVINSEDAGDSFEVGTLPIDLLDGTKIDVDDRPVVMEDGSRLNVTGWVAYAKDPYKDEAMAGIRVFARGKLVAQPRDFDIHSGFTGEFKMRSYVVGEVQAEWLDEGDEDLVRSDRQDIIWNSDKGDAFRKWGQELIRELARRAEASIQNRTWEDYLEASGLEDMLKGTVGEFQSSIENAAKYLVRRIDRDALKDPDYVGRITSFALAIGPHRTLLDALQKAADETNTSLETVLDLFEKARIAEMYSLGQVARERVDAVQRLMQLIDKTETLERELQQLIEEAPWILHPDWTPLSKNQTLERVRAAFQSWYKKRFGEDIATSAINNPGMRPDFILLTEEGQLEIVEIKKPGHALNDEEMERAYKYLENLRQFLDENADLRAAFPRCRLTIVRDRDDFKKATSGGACKDDDVRARTWEEVMNSTMRAHEDYIAAIKTLDALKPEQSTSEKEDG